MTITDDFMEDRDRRDRTGLDECVLCASKSVDQVTRIVGQIFEEGRRVLLTRLTPEQHSKLPKETRAVITYDPLSCTGVVGEPIKLNRSLLVAIVSGGTSDVSVVAEAAKTLEYYGYVASLFQDIGVAGLWRVVDAAPALQNFPIIIAVAGMDAALPTVLAGLVPSAVIAVPTSVGYGVSAGGHAALNSLLSSCVPGLTVVNIDNGFGAASAAIRILNSREG
ncbi:MAG: nickel pincer cofactor biosynthesis protein LarB [Candidatus Melainabacteria bacterium]|nr:nickel pincer cofactor biosynthesis protein LarB [Candidatus Melainabacteria bacterium]